MAIKIYKKNEESTSKTVVRNLSYVILIAGILLMFWAYYPMISFEIYARLFINKKIPSPLPQTDIVSSLQFAQSVYAAPEQSSSNLRDFTQAHSWFPVRNLSDGDIDLEEYSLSIPKLNLTNLNVKVGGDDLSASLIHYLPRSKPGQYGKVAIFGHSTLPQLYNDSDYKTVFTYLPQMDIGDTVIINSEGKKFEYEVYNMYIVDPDEVSVLEQKFNAAYLTLVTCVPPGTYKQRLIVEAKLKNHNQP